MEIGAKDYSKMKSASKGEKSGLDNGKSALNNGTCGGIYRHTMSQTFMSKQS